MAQFARPSSDITTTGWSCSTGGSFYALVDEAVADDADYVYIAVPTNKNLEIKLSAVSTPGAGSRYVVLRWKDGYSGSGAHTPWVTGARISLVEGTTVLGYIDIDPPGGPSFTTYSWDVSAYSPSAWNDLRIRIGSGSGGSGVYVSQMYLQVPDTGGGHSGGFTVTDTTETVGGHDVDRDTYPTYESNYRVSVGDDPTGTCFQTRYARPTDAFDAQNGQFCTLSGQWVPGHLVVWVDGAPYAHGNAPRPTRLVADPSEMMF